MHSVGRNDQKLFRFQRILLGGCLISFAQDKITEDELFRYVSLCSNVTPICPGFSTMQSFPVDQDLSFPPPPLPDESDPNDFPGKSTNDFAHDPPFSKQYQRRCRDRDLLIDPFANPPLTAIIRKRKAEILDLLQNFFLQQPDRPPSLDLAQDSTFNGDSSDTEANDSAKVPPESFDRKLSQYLSRLEFKSDGTGFIDDSWELMIDREDLRLWRRPMMGGGHETRQTSVAHQQHSSTKDSAAPSRARYEYRCTFCRGLCVTIYPLAA